MLNTSISKSFYIEVIRSVNEKRMGKRQVADRALRDEIILTSPTSMTISRKFVFTVDEIKSSLCSQSLPPKNYFQRL